MKVYVRLPTNKGDEITVMDSEELKKKLDTHLLIGKRKVNKKQKVMDVEVDVSNVERFAIQSIVELEEQMRKASVETGGEEAVSSAIEIMPRLIGG